MANFDCCEHLSKYYHEDVRLGADRRKVLADVRDINLQRIRDGLNDLARETGKPHAAFNDYKNQGGYAMHTLNQAEQNDYDIDVALLFDSADLPTDPESARVRVRDALAKRASGFVTEPEVRKNAVTVWYEDGYHIDFAIYRVTEGYFSTTTEHASDSWVAREPMEVNDWFCKAVDEKSPSNNFWQSDITTEPKQMRRIVRFVKRFCKSRASWNLPGGMIISTLISEVYQPDRFRDDVSLHKTLEALRTRLSVSQVVTSPVRPQELTKSEKHMKQVGRLLKKLDQFVPKLAVLDDAGCTEDKAKAAWNLIFNHAYWRKSVVKSAQEAADSRGLTGWAFIRCGLAKSKGGTVYRNYTSNSLLLPKGLGLKFTVESTSVQAPYEVRWKAFNEGDEAEEAGQISWEKDEEACWTSTQYRGLQRMTVELWRYGSLHATATHLVRIA